MESLIFPGIQVRDAHFAKRKQPLRLVDMREVADAFRRLRLRDGLLAAVNDAVQRAKQLFILKNWSACELVRVLVAACRREVLCEPSKIRLKVLNRIEGALVAWERAARPDFPTELQYLWLVYYNTCADSEKEQGHYAVGLEVLQKAIRVLEPLDSVELRLGALYTHVNRASLSLALRDWEAGLRHAEEALLQAAHPELSGMHETGPVLHSCVLAHFYEAVALEFLSHRETAKQAYLKCQALIQRYKYSDPFLLQEVHFALADLQGTQPSPLPAPLQEGYYQRSSLDRIVAALHQQDSHYFLSVNSYYNCLIHKQLHLEKDAPHIPQFSKAGSRQFELQLSQDRRALRHLRLRKSCRLPSARSISPCLPHFLASQTTIPRPQPLLRKCPQVKSSGRAEPQSAGKFDRTQANEEIEEQMHDISQDMKSSSQTSRRKELRTSVSALALSCLGSMKEARVSYQEVLAEHDRLSQVLRQAQSQITALTAENQALKKRLGTFVKPAPSFVPAQENSQLCENCGQQVPSTNFDMHVLHCERVNKRCAVCRTLLPADQFLKHTESLRQDVAGLVADIAEGDLQAVESRLAHGMSPSAADERDNSGLHHAAKAGHLAIAQLLLSQGCPANCQNAYGETALHVALTQRKSEVARYLLSAGADPLLPNRLGDSPYTLAMRQADHELVLLFSQLTNSPERKPRTASAFGRSRTTRPSDL